MTAMGVGFLVSGLALLPLPGQTGPAAGPAPAAGRGSVTLYATVEENGNAVAGLGKRNFQVFENGRQQLTARAEPVRVSSLLVLVESGLTSRAFQDGVRSALHHLAAAMPPVRSCRLITYSRSAGAATNLQGPLSEFRGACPVLRRSDWTLTDTHDAIWQAVLEIGSEPDPHVLILIGTGLDTGSRHTSAELQRQFESENILFYAVAPGTEDTREVQPSGVRLNRDFPAVRDAFLNALAAAAGGQAYYPEAEADYADSMRELRAVLQSQYRVVYQRTAEGAANLYKLRVEAFRIEGDRRHDFKVKVRESWRHGP